MSEKTVKIIDLTYLQVAIIFAVLVLLKQLNVLSLPFNYQLFACALPLLAIPALLMPRPPNMGRLRGTLPILVGAFLFALAVRLLPFAHSSVPLGYDPGFYKYTMDLYASALPQIPEAGLAHWVKEMYPQGLFVLSDSMHVTAGTSGLQFMNLFFPLFGAFLVFPVFVVTRSLFDQRVGLIAAVLYAVSYTQFAVFDMFYFKNVLGLMFLLLAIYALEKEKHGLMAVMFAGLGIFHRPEFLLFALILIPYFILHRRKGIILGALGAAVLVAPFWIPRWEVNWAMLSGAVETAVTNIQTGSNMGGGTFFDFATYTGVSLAYLPFALMGAIYLIMKRNWNSVLFYFLIGTIIVVFQLFFFNRFIIPLDIAFVILAAVGIEYAILRRVGKPRVALAVAAVLLFVAAIIPTINASNDASPRITEQQLETVGWIAANTEEDAYVVATNQDAPWVLGWSQRRVIAPGLFEWTVHGKEDWLNFLGTCDLEAAKQFLDVYEGPIYIYYSTQQEWNYLNLEKFDNPCFPIVYQEGEAIIYQYIGGG